MKAGALSSVHLHTAYMKACESEWNEVKACGFTDTEATITATNIAPNLGEQFRRGMQGGSDGRIVRAV